MTPRACCCPISLRRCRGRAARSPWWRRAGGAWLPVRTTPAAWLAALADAAAEALSKTDQPLSAQALRLRDGEWTDFAGDGEAFAPFLDLMRGQWTRDYAEQKQLLDQLYAQGGEEVLVASYAPMQ